MVDIYPRVRPMVCATASAVGVAFLIIGGSGFIPGVTRQYGEMTFAGHESGARLLGVFQVSVLHNLVHLGYGLAGLALARRARSARRYLVVGGLSYLVFWLYGLATHSMSAANFVPFDKADDWLHLVLGIGMILLGMLTAGRAVVRS